MRDGMARAVRLIAWVFPETRAFAGGLWRLVRPATEEERARGGW